MNDDQRAKATRHQARHRQAVAEYVRTGKHLRSVRRSVTPTLNRYMYEQERAERIRQAQRVMLQKSQADRRRREMWDGIKVVAMGLLIAVIVILLGTLVH